jgi:hypothetical protein
MAQRCTCRQRSIPDEEKGGPEFECLWVDITGGKDDNHCYTFV